MSAGSFILSHSSIFDIFTRKLSLPSAHCHPILSKEHNLHKGKAKITFWCHKKLASHPWCLCTEPGAFPIFLSCVSGTVSFLFHLKMHIIMVYTNEMLTREERSKQTLNCSYLRFKQRKAHFKDSGNCPIVKNNHYIINHIWSQTISINCH